jgi:hypothetical protein
MIVLDTEKQIEVTNEQYNYIMNEYSGICFGKQEANKFYIRLGIYKYKTLIENYLNK